MKKQNVKGADNTETGPDVPEDWYLNYEGPAPVVEGIYEQNYGVDIGNGAIPIDFYVKKWGIPKGFEEETEEDEEDEEDEEGYDFSSQPLWKKILFGGVVGLLLLWLFVAEGDVSACDCARAMLYDSATSSKETLKKCREKEADMEWYDQQEWNKEKINCL